MNRYESLTTNTLIKGVQHCAVELLNGNVPVNKKSFFEKDLREMRMVLIPRLRSEDRYQAKFFRIGSYVKYHKIIADDWDDFNSSAVPDRNGKVTGHVDGKVLVQFEGETFSTLCEPIDLKIMFIR